MVSTAHKREQWRIRRARHIALLSPEKVAEMYAKNSARRSAIRAAKAIAEGRIPGKKGNRKFSPEEKKAADKARYNRWKQKNLVKAKASDAERHRKVRADNAVASGRKPGLIGRERVLTDAQRAANRRAYNIAYCENNRELRSLRAKAYYETHKEQTFARGRNRRSIKKGNGGKHTAADIKELWFLQKGKCTWCLKSFGEEKPHVDHRIPIAKGGSNDKSNLQLLHARCNKVKAAHHPIEHGLKYGLLAW